MNVYLIFNYNQNYILKLLKSRNWSTNQHRFATPPSPPISLVTTCLISPKIPAWILSHFVTHESIYQILAKHIQNFSVQPIITSHFANSPLSASHISI